VVTVLQRAGFTQVSQRGSHLKLRAVRNGRTRTIIVKHPAHQLPIGTFKSILRQADLTQDEFDTLLA
jgi:predicted RNA binding protein YcfA (HicA-like mRNA interferase family)